MKSKNRLSKIIAFLVLLAVVAMIFVANTYSKYATNASGSDSAVVAKWSFTVNDEEIAVAGDAKTIEFNLFDTIYDSNGEEETDVADGVIAPGTSGEFEFALKNTSDVTAQYAIKLDVDNTDIPLEFSFDGEEWASDLTNLIAQDNLAMDASKNVKVMWRWAFGADTATDISLSEQTVNVSATIDVIQANAHDELRKVTYKLFPELETSLRETVPATSAIQTIAPFYYEDVDLFENKNLTQISMYVKNVNYKDDYATMKISTINAPESFVVGANAPTTFLETYTIKLPSSYFQGETNIGRWVDIDLTQYAYKSDGTIATQGIQVGEGETLAISSEKNDTIVWNVDQSSFETQPFYYNNAGKIAFSADSGLNFLFEYTVYLENTDEDNGNTNEDTLLNELKGKKLSILGDSISTYNGVSNNATYNSTLSGNATYYGAVSYTSSVSQDETYWQQIIDTFDMELNVNNSWSGGTVTGIKNTNKAINRASQLHNVQSEMPDVILVYVGINDLRYDQTPELFEEGYTTMLNTIKTNYSNAQVFCIGMPNRNGNDYENGEYTDEEAITFNTAIKNSIEAVNGKFYYVDLFNSEYSNQVYFDNSINTGSQNQYTNSTLDNLHPNEIGMDYMTEIIIDRMNEVLIENN